MDSASIVVLGGSEPERAQLAAQLVAAGVAARAETRLVLGDGLPALVVVTGPEAAHLVSEARDVPALAEVPILAVVAAIPPSAAAEALAAGATDVARQPVPSAVLAARCRNLCKLARKDAAPAQTLSRINEVLTADGDDAAALIQVLTITASVLGFDRASLVAHIEGSDHAFVIAANDAEPLQRFTLAIAEYPEIAEAIRTLSPVMIDDVLVHPLTAPISDLLSTRRIRGIAVFPVQWRGRALGAILLRKRAPGVQHVGPRGIELAKLIASITAAHLRHGAVLESLRDQTHRISRARYEAERRLRGIDSLKEHFEAGADGVVVLDDAGRILFVNRTAERITGFARDGLLGSELIDLVGTDYRSQISDTVSRVLAGVNVDAFDLQLSTTSGAPVWVSVSTSTVLAGSGAVILAFRDVTAERGLEHELRSTKEFLERLIDSTVDAIIAADVRGRIILFNQGAERLFGYRARDVIGKIPVWELYEAGGAKQIMRMLRSTAHGGVGRLEQTRREVRTASGEQVPVSITASTLYERDREVATVGILTDLRERIRMEQRLLDAQQKLQLSEKQALVAELAGAAAHELNQPLTSIMGYAGLIERQSPKDASYLRAVTIILSEAERMAGIVKKIGKITKYETTDYVGTARMLDLERAAPESDPAIPIGDETKTGEFASVASGAATRPVGAASPAFSDDVPDSDLADDLADDLANDRTAEIGANRTADRSDRVDRMMDDLADLADELSGDRTGEHATRRLSEHRTDPPGDLTDRRGDRRSASESSRGAERKPGSEFERGGDRKPESESERGGDREIGSELDRGADRKPGGEFEHVGDRRIGSESSRGAERKPGGESDLRFDRKPESESERGTERKLGGESDLRFDRKSGSESEHVGDRKIGSESSRGADRKPESGSERMGDRTIGSESSRGGERKPGSEFEHGGDRKPESESERGGDREICCESDRGAERRPGRESDHRLDRKPESESERGIDRKPGGESDRGGDRRPGSESERGRERGPDRGDT